jgi:DNA-binding MarR family transcriptional regulator
MEGTMKSVPLMEIAKNLNSISWSILKLLNHQQSISYSTVRQELEISQEKASKELARLEGAYLIESKRDMKDQRFSLYTMTRYGKEILCLRKEV